MKEIVFHGRAGQGIVTAAELLANAAGMEGYHSQAFPFFGSEKRGPPVVSFCRINKEPIAIHEQIYHPDVVVVADSSIIPAVNVTAGLKPGGIVIVNSSKPRDISVPNGKLYMVDGTSIALKHIGKQITNTVMLGALAKITGIVKLESLKKAIEQRFKPKLAEPNIKTIEECYSAVKV